MIARGHAPFLLAAVGLGLCGAAAETPPPAKTPAAAQTRLSVETARLTAASHAREIPGYARVIDAGPLAQLDADLSAALASASASQAEARRAGALASEDQIVAARVAEAAVAVARADQARVRLLRTRLGLEWGPGLTALGDAGRARLIQSIARGDAVLLRIDSAAAATGADAISLDLGGGGVRARVLGPARTADARLQSSGRLALVTGPQARTMGVGLAVPIHIPAGPRTDGVVAPASAVLRAEGQSWVYIRTGPETFARRLLVSPVATADGLFVASGLRPGEVVVTRGAAALYAAEQAGG